MVPSGDVPVRLDTRLQVIDLDRPILEQFDPSVPIKEILEVDPLRERKGEADEEVFSPEPPMVHFRFTFYDTPAPLVPVRVTESPQMGGRRIPSSQKKINREVLEAARVNSASVMAVVVKHRRALNGVNLATAFHRLAREADAKQVVEAPDFVLMLDLAEKKAQREIQRQDGSLPPNCCTLICWSCATLGAFREALFSSLAHIAAGHLDACQGYEVTNMLWAFSQLHKFQPQMAINLQGDLQNFLDAVMHLFLNRGLGKMKDQILISALLSVVNFPSSVPEQSALFERLVGELATRWARLTSDRRIHIHVACEIMRQKNLQLVQKTVQMLKPICPELGISRGFKKPGFRQDVDASQV